MTRQSKLIGSATIADVRIGSIGVRSKQRHGPTHSVRSVPAAHSAGTYPFNLHGSCTTSTLTNGRRV